jgi:gliding motility-associated-like protein
LSGTAVIDDETSPVTRIHDLAVGENTFSWTVTNGICSEVSLVKINVDDLFIPSVITPNGDGKNDTFIINALIGPVKLLIFNKWGNEEYRSSDYANEWDGTNNKGDQLTEDTYYYIITLGNGTVRKGTVLIMR